jgi:hypothetical protein
LFTVDFNGNDINEIDGSDDMPFSFLGSTGSGAGGSDLVSGEIRAVDITNVSPAALTADVASYVDFLGNFPGGADFTATDTLIFDVVLFAGSALLDEIGVAVGTDPSFLNPDGAGYLDPCTPGVPLGCSQNVPTSQLPDNIVLSGAFAPIFPGAALFEFDKLGLSGANLEGGETGIRMFISWADNGPGSPLNRIDQTAVFMLSSGLNAQFFTDIVPEPSTGLLVMVGLALMTGSRKQRR